MYNSALKDLETISQTIGSHPDYVQGGGGNTSAKLNNELMAIKASGYQLKEVTATQGYVVVNYSNINKYYDSVDLNTDTDFEKESIEIAKKNVVETEGIKTLRPSVEVGFHSILKKYVIHTHAVYANILCCSKNGEQLARKIFAGKDYNFLWVPYINPGFNLTLRIKKDIKQYIENFSFFPEVIFMENHGLIVTCDDYKKCLDLHTTINLAIKNYLKINETYPKIQIDTVDDNTFKSNTAYIKNYLAKNKITQDYFERNVLYPDQLVYLNGSIAVDTMDNKLNINTKTGEITYRCNLKEAKTMEETLLAYLYVIDRIKNNELELKTMTNEEKNFIKNWESEKYRKSLLKK